MSNGLQNVGIDDLMQKDPHALEPQNQLLQPNWKEREQNWQSQETPAVQQMSTSTHHCQVNRECNEETHWKEAKLVRILGLTSGRAASSEWSLPHAQIDQVAASASKNNHCHIAPYLASPADETGHHRDQDEYVQEEARDQNQNFRGGAKVGKNKGIGFC